MIEIIDKTKCSGCSACMNSCNNNAIEMQFDEYGISYPLVNKDKCVECHACENVCPYYHLDTLPKQAIESYPPIYASYNKDEDIRRVSTSGGIFSLLAQYIIENGGIVFAARFDEKFHIEHAKADCTDEIGYFRGSKYAQSEISYIYRDIKEILNINRKVLFVGTPCQIAGIKQYLNKEYDNLYTCDFICMGIGSPQIWENYLSQFEDINALKSFTFKDKKDGWHNWQIKIVYQNNKEKYIKRHNSPFMVGYLKRLYLRPSCFVCPFKGINRMSDFTIADGWGIDKIDPVFDDDRGTTTLMLHSGKAKDIFEVLKMKMAYRSMTINDVMKYNQYSCESVPKNDNSKLFYTDLKKRGLRHAMLKYCGNDKKNITKILNLIYHAFFKKKPCK